MKIDHLTDEPTEEFETRLKRGLDHIASQTPTRSPLEFDPDALPLVVADISPNRRLVPYLTAAAAAAMVVTGLVAITSRTDGQPAAESVDTTAPSVATIPSVSTTSTVGASTPPGCEAGALGAAVPDVVTISFEEATRRLELSGFVVQGSFESTPVGDASGTDPVIRQSVAPGEVASCGATINLTVPYQPGPLYAIQTGDTYASIATSLEISPQELLMFNGATEAEIAVDGQTIDTPLETGRALRTTPWVPHDGS